MERSVLQGNGMAEREWSTSRSLDFFKIMFSPVFPVRMVSGSTSHRHHDRPKIPECLTSVLSAWNLMEIGTNTPSHSLVPSSYPGKSILTPHMNLVGQPLPNHGEYPVIHKRVR